MQKCFGENPEVYGAYLDAFERYSLNPYPLNRKDSLAPSFRIPLLFSLIVLSCFAVTTSRVPMVRAQLARVRLIRLELIESTSCPFPFY